VRYERFEIQTATSRLDFDLHPRLTVLAGLGAVEREDLIDALIGAFGTNLVGESEIRLHRAMQLRASDLAAGTQDAAASAHVRRLADVEPERLWAAAERPSNTEAPPAPQEDRPTGLARLRSRRRVEPATESWDEVAGDIDVDWAFDHRDEIDAAARLRHDMSALTAVSSTAPDLNDDYATDLARALVGRLHELRDFGRAGESFPLLLDDPFVGVDAGMQSAVLDLLQHLSASQQIIFFTDDEDVASWARLEALTGALSIIEPARDTITI